jgi:tetratricopeptide (TPR) repeat protein
MASAPQLSRSNFMTNIAIVALSGIENSVRAVVAALRLFIERDPGAAWTLALALAALGLMWTRPWRELTARGRAERLRRKGLEHTLAGRPAEAQKFFQRALQQSANIPDPLRVRLLVCLGDALMDGDRMQEAEDCFSVALQIGDRTGSCQGSIADLLLERKREPEKVLKVADLAYSLNAENYRGAHIAWKEQYLGLREAVCLARKAQAFALLDQNLDAKEALDKAVGLLKAAEEADAAKRFDETLKLFLFDRRYRSREKLQFAALHFMIGSAYLALKNTPEAIAQFNSGREADPKGKYRKLCQQRLDQLSPAGQPIAVC